MAKNPFDTKALDDAFVRAIEAAKKTAVGPKGEFYPTSLSGKQIAKAEPTLRRHISAVFTRHYKKTNDDTAAWNATLEEVGGPFAQNMPMPAYLKRMIVGAIVPEVRRGIVRRTAKRAGKTETWEVRSVDAWRESEGGWTENQSFRAGDLTLPPSASNRDILTAMRVQGYLTTGSAGKVAVEEHGGDPPYMWIVDKSSREPLFAVTRDLD